MQNHAIRTGDQRDSRALTEFFKGIAILLVILVHSHQSFALSPVWSAFPRFGQMGTQLFFVLSSFGLCHSFAKKQPRFLPHMKKRISKLAIGYWGAILLHAIYRAITASVTKGDVLSALNLLGIVINALFLNGFVYGNGINNSIVRGGWYVGTTVILYALFPLLYKLYFENGQDGWKKIRIVVFPLSLFCAASLDVILWGSLHPALSLDNNSFLYFSFLNQLTPFVLGIVLYDLRERICKKRYTLPLFALTLSSSVVLFFGDWKLSFVICPTLVALSFLFLYLSFWNSQTAMERIDRNTSLWIRAVRGFGRVSFPIYLTHTFIVYEFAGFCLRYLRPICSNELLLYVILLPIEICLIRIVGYGYDRLISAIQKTKRKPTK